jgi:hypothetical protein
LNLEESRDQLQPAMILQKGTSAKGQYTYQRGRRQILSELCPNCPDAAVCPCDLRAIAQHEL